MFTDIDTMDIIMYIGGCSSMVEHQLPKLRVASSILVTRSSKIKASGDLLNPLEAFLVPNGTKRISLIFLLAFSTFGI